jgi:hypothetical protein
MAYQIKSTRRKNDLVDDIIAFEEGNLSENDTIKLFQKLENNGQAYSLQGMYGRTATALIGAGLIKPNMKYHTKEQVADLKRQNQINKAFSDF